MKEEQLENPIFGYVVMAVALLVSLLSVTVFGQVPSALLPTTLLPTTLQSNSATLNIDPHCSGVGLADPGHGESGNLAAAESSVENTCRRRWILGVRTTSTSAGCVVTAVIQGSAAEKSGLVTGDRVITVDGKQVGWIGRQLVPMHCAIDAAASGRTRLLVQQAGSGSIKTVSVELCTLPESLGH